MSLLLAAVLTFHLGAEVPVDPYTRIIPADGYQSDPDVATNGRDALAVWSDSRAWSAFPSVRATRLHGEYALDTYGIEIAAHAGSARVASDGNDYLIAYTVYERWDGDDDPSTAHAARIDDGIVTRRTDIGNGNVVDVASDGATYCVILGSEYDTAAPAVVVLALDGTVLAKHALPARGQAVLPRRGGGYWVVAIVDQIIQLLPVTSSGIGEGKRVRAVPGV